jgi:hydroxymethylpyrimidine pyrophosphatase-like HAD family hydrolase
MKRYGHPDIKLFIFDFDGTALGGHEPYSQFPDDFSTFLDKLRQKKILWAVNSGWSINGQMQVIKSSTVRSFPAFLIGDTGREIGIAKDGSIEKDRSYSDFILQCDADFRANNGNMIGQMLIELLKSKLLISYTFDFHHRNTVHACCENTNRGKLLQFFSPLLESELFYLMESVKDQYCCTLIPTYVNKRDAIQIMQKRLGISADQTVFAGDEINDQPVLDPSTARWLVCSSNANELVKRKVQKLGGIVAKQSYSWGVIEGVSQLLNL